jgi:hypothetical protein
MAQEVSVAPVLEGTKGSNPTTYTQFVRYWTVQLKTQYPESKDRKQAYLQMWKALSPAEKKAWVAPTGDAPADAPVVVSVVEVVPTPQKAHRLTGYILFAREQKMLTKLRGTKGEKKVTEMWKDLKGVPAEGQDYWNTLAKNTQETK